MYEVVTGEHCEFDLFKNEDLSDSGRAVWPRRGDLPGVQGIWLGWVMDKCWREGAFEMHMNWWSSWSPSKMSLLNWIGCLGMLILV